MTSRSGGGRSRAVAVLTIWVPRVLLAIVFVFAGAVKFSAQSLYVDIFDQIGLGTWFRYFTGLLEIGGGLLLLVPRAAAVGFILLGCTMAGAAAFWIVTGNPFAAAIPTVLLLAIAGFGWSEVARCLGKPRAPMAR